MHLSPEIGWNWQMHGKAIIWHKWGRKENETKMASDMKLYICRIHMSYDIVHFGINRKIVNAVKKTLIWLNLVWFFTCILVIYMFMLSELSLIEIESQYNQLWMVHIVFLFSNSIRYQNQMFPTSLSISDWI